MTKREIAAAGWDLESRFEYLLFSAFHWLAIALPRNWALALGAGVGSGMARLPGRWRRVALANLALAFPDRTAAEHRRILAASGRNLGRSAVEFYRLPKMRPAEVASLVSIPDRSAWERLLRDRDERGLVVVTAHFGNWELLAYSHGLLGHPVTLVHKPMRNRFVDAFIASVRARAGTRSIPKRAAAREALRTLRQREILVIPTDQNQPRHEGIFVDFFGRAANTNPGAARLARHTGAALWPVFLVRDGESDRHRVEILPRIEVADTGDSNEDIRATTQRCVDAIEAMLRRHPEQWIWFHNRWRTRPLDEGPNDD